MKFTDLNLELQDQETFITINGVDIAIKKYLPINNKVALVTYVVENSLDETTGCFSPARVEVFFSLALLQYYTEIELDEELGVEELYDLLDSNDVISKVIKAIPFEEYEFISDLVHDTISDISQYNNSAAGIIHSMSFDASNLDESIQKILTNVKNKEGLETLSEIKNVVGTD